MANLQIGALSNGSLVVIDLDPAIAPVIFKSLEERCTCSTCYAHKKQCKHEIKLCGMQFAPDRWELRHMTRVRLQGSLVGWVSRSNSTVLDNRGLGTKNINVEVALNGEPDAVVFGGKSNVDDNEYNK